MSGALYRAMLKGNARTIASYTAGMVFYLWLFIWVYPSIQGSQSLNALLSKMPSGLRRVLGYTVGMTHLSSFLGGEFYSLLYLLIMAIYAILTAGKLVAHLIDNGSMAYLLATPVSRVRVAATQAAVLMTGILVIGAVTTVGALVGAHWFVHHAGLNAGYFVEMNVVGVLLFAVVAGYSFAFSCVARDERSALAFSAIVTMAFYALHTVSDLSRHFHWMGRLSLFSAFNSQQLIRGQGHFAEVAPILVLAAVALFIIAIAGFRRRPLAL